MWTVAHIACTSLCWHNMQHILRLHQGGSCCSKRASANLEELSVVLEVAVCEHALPAPVVLGDDQAAKNGADVLQLDAGM